MKFRFFKKQQDTTNTSSINLVNILATTESKASLLAKKALNILAHPATRIALVAVLAILVCSTSSYAQDGTITQTSADITTTIKNLFTQIYDNFRIPITAVALTVAAAKFASSDANGRRQSYLIGGALILFWIVPGVIKFITDVSGTGK